MASSTSTLGPLKNRIYLVYWLAGLSANFGWQIQLVGAAWLMTSLGGSPTLVALVQTSVSLPVMLLSLPGGALSDLLGRRAVVLSAQLFLITASIVLAICAYFNVLTPFFLLLCTFLIGCGRALYYPAWQTMAFQLVSKHEATSAVAMNSMNQNIARSVGPAVGGFIVAVSSAFVAFVVNALGNLSVIIVTRSWPKPKSQNDLPPEPFGSAVMAGVRYVSLSPTLVTIMVRSGIFNIAAVAFLALLPLVARDFLQGGPQTFGFLLGAFGGGAIIGSLCLNSIRQRIALEPFLAMAYLGFAAATAFLAMSNNVIVSGVCAAFAGAGWVFAQVTHFSSIQLYSPRWVLSRSIGIYQIFVFGGNALGSLIWGVTAGGTGTSSALLASAVLMAIGAGLGLRFKIKEMDVADLDPHSEWVAPTPHVDMVLKSGPILTTVIYKIREEDVPEFLTAMREKRRNRIRDGAMRWTLSRDIQDPTQWFERFRVATWAEAQRLHSRRTVAGAQATLAVRRLHQGPGRPEAHYELVRDPAMHTTPEQSPDVPRMDH